MKNSMLLLCLGIAITTGCTKPNANHDGAGEPLVIDFDPPGLDGVHDHSMEGPHQGTLIELGSEQYHAELVHDQSAVTIYILDSSGTKTLPIDSPELTINMVHDGKPVQFRLTPAPDEGEPSGYSSRYTIQSPELIEELEHDHAATRLAVLIKGKQYRGTIKHDHAACDHDHLR